MLSNRSSTYARLLYLALAVGYLVTGKLLSGISAQSQVVAIWAPAGFALVGCYLWWWRFFPAVFIASVAFNFSSHSGATFGSLLGPIGIEVTIIALGATLQAAVGGALLRHWLGNPLYHQSDKQAFAFVFGVGLVVNLISPNIGVYALGLLNPQYSMDNHWSNVFYWWLGDSLGVLIITPLLLSIIAYQRKDPKHQNPLEVQPPKHLVFSAAALLFVSVTLTTMFFSQYSIQNAQELARREASVMESNLYRQLNSSMSQVAILANFIQYAPDVDRQHFHAFAAELMHNQPIIKALSWDPIIDWNNKKPIEQQLSRIYGRPIALSGEPKAAGDPAVIVKLIEPEKDNLSAIGFNVYSDAKRRSVLNNPSPPIKPVATPIIQLVQSTTKEPAYLLFMPVYSPATANDSTAPTLLGYAAGVFLVNQVLDQSMDLNRRKMFIYEMYEQGASTVFSANTGKTDITLGTIPTAQNLLFHLAGQKWYMNLVTNPEFLSHYQSRLSLMVYILQVFLVAIIMLLILMMNNRHIVLNAKVSDRTRALAKAKQLSDDAYKAKSRFLANMSHEIRTPLNAVIGFSQLIRQTDDPSVIDTYVEKIEISSSNLLNIVNDILDISKIESQKLRLEHRLFDMHLLLKRIEVMFENQRENKVRWSIEDHLPRQLYYLGDQNRIEQILINLVSNAFKFTRSGYVTLSAELVSRDDEAALLGFAVKDSGIGIEKGAQATLFDAFNQADSSTSRRFGGTGLGLTICRELCQMMQGDIVLESEPGAGSTFTAHIRLSISSSEPLVKQSDTLGSFPSLKVLVAEDNAINQLVIQELLKTLDVAPTIVSNGKEAVEAVQSGAFDLVLMDCQMPVMDGYQATRLIREYPQYQHLPIIALTADVMPEDKLQAFDSGFTDHLGKPIEIHRLSNCLSLHAPLIDG